MKLNIINIKKMKKSLLLTLLLVFILPAPSLADFSDVSTDYGHKTAIDFVKSKNIVSGYSDGTFKPDNPINRAELVKIIVNANADSYDIESCDIEKNLSFSDIDKSAWYAPYLCYAVKNNIISGYPDGTFRPQREVIYAEATKIITKGIGFNIEEGDVWYANYNDKIIELNAIPSTVSSMLKSVTRGEIAKMIYETRSEKRNLEAYIETICLEKEKFLKAEPNTTESSFQAGEEYNKIYKKYGLTQPSLDEEAMKEAYLKTEEKCGYKSYPSFKPEDVISSYTEALCNTSEEKDLDTIAKNNGFISFYHLYQINEHHSSWLNENSDQYLQALKTSIEESCDYDEDIFIEILSDIDCIRDQEGAEEEAENIVKEHGFFNNTQFSLLLSIYTDSLMGTMKLAQERAKEKCGYSTSEEEDISTAPVRARDVGRLMNMHAIKDTLFLSYDDYFPAGEICFMGEDTEMVSSDGSQDSEEVLNTLKNYIKDNQFPSDPLPDPNPIITENFPNGCKGYLYKSIKATDTSRNHTAYIILSNAEIKANAGQDCSKVDQIDDLESSFITPPDEEFSEENWCQIITGS